MRPGATVPLTATSPRLTDLNPATTTPVAPPRPHTRGGDDGGAKFHLEDRRELRYWLSIACAVVCSWISFLTPAFLRYRIADLWGDLFYVTSPTYRKNVAANVEQVLGPTATDEQIKRAVRSIFRTSARNFADLLLVPRTSLGHFNRETGVERGSFALLDEALSQGRGALVLTGHVGAFDLMGQVLNERGYKLTVVTGRTTARFVFDAVCYLRRARGMRLVEASPSGVRRAIQAVRRGEIAVLVSDRDFFQSGKPVAFFGRETTLPPGIVRIARDSGAPIVPIFGRRLARGHNLTIEPGFVVPKTDEVEDDLRVGMERVVASLQRAISQAPDQWVMFQRVWPLEPVSPVRVFPVGSPLESELLEKVGAVLPARRPRSKPRT